MSKRLRSYQEFSCEVKGFFRAIALSRSGINERWLSIALGTFEEIVDDQFTNINSLTFVVEGKEKPWDIDRLVLSFKTNFMDDNDGNHYMIVLPYSLDLDRIIVKQLNENEHAKKKKQTEV